MSNTEMVRAARSLIGRSRIFGAEFIKADGSVRTGSFRLGVKKGLAPGRPGMSYNPESRGNLVVYDMNKQGYRTIKLQRLRKLTIQGHVIEV